MNSFPQQVTEAFKYLEEQGVPVTECNQHHPQKTSYSYRDHIRYWSKIKRVLQKSFVFGNVVIRKANAVQQDIKE